MVPEAKRFGRRSSKFADAPWLLTKFRRRFVSLNLWTSRLRENWPAFKEERKPIDGRPFSIRARNQHRQGADRLDGRGAQRLRLSDQSRDGQGADLRGSARTVEGGFDALARGRARAR